MEPVKLTLQRTLSAKDKSSWEEFKAQYGIHMDPRPAYQHCHELQYNQFGSVQGLMSAMSNYQRISPGMLTGSVLESTEPDKEAVDPMISATDNG